VTELCPRSKRQGPLTPPVARGKRPRSCSWSTGCNCPTYSRGRRYRLQNAKAFAKRRRFKLLNLV